MSAEEPKRVEITAEVAANNIGAFIMEVRETALWHKDMNACLMYLFKKAQAQEQLEAQIPPGETFNLQN